MSATKRQGAQQQPPQDALRQQAQRAQQLHQPQRPANVTSDQVDHATDRLIEHFITRHTTSISKQVQMSRHLMRDKIDEASHRLRNQRRMCCRHHHNHRRCSKRRHNTMATHENATARRQSRHNRDDGARRGQRGGCIFTAGARSVASIASASTQGVLRGYKQGWRTSQQRSETIAWWEPSCLPVIRFILSPASDPHVGRMPLLRGLCTGDAHCQIPQR